MRFMVDSRDGRYMEQIRDTSARVLSPLRRCDTAGFEALKALHLAYKHPSFSVGQLTYTSTPKYREGFGMFGLVLYDETISAEAAALRCISLGSRSCD